MYDVWLNWFNVWIEKKNDAHISVQSIRYKSPTLYIIKNVNRFCREGCIDMDAYV